MELPVFHNKLFLLGFCLMIALPINAMWDPFGLTHVEEIELRDRVDNALEQNDTRDLQEIFGQIKEKHGEYELLRKIKPYGMRFFGEAKTPQAVDMLVDYLGKPHYDESGLGSSDIFYLFRAQDEIIKHMIARGFHLNSCDPKSTILHDCVFLARRNKEFTMDQIVDRVKFFLAYGGDPSIKSNLDQKTALDEASEGGYAQMVALFERQQKILDLLKANKAPNVVTLLRNREIYGTFHSPR